jgi:putative transposase
MSAATGWWSATGTPRRARWPAGVGQVEVVRPRVDDRRVDAATGERVQFQSVILPRWCRRSPKVAAVLPLLYLHGLSSLDFVPAFFGAAAGLSAWVITRLTTQWQAERTASLQRSLADRDDVDGWADGVHCNLRLEDGRLCWLVLVGCAPTAPRSWWRSPTGSASPQTTGRSCWGTAAAAAWVRRW